MKSVLCFVAVLAVASAFPWDQQCPDFDVQDPFLLANFTGTWYEQYSKNTPWELGTCVQTTYTLDETTEVLAADSTLKTVFGGASEVRGSAVRTNTSSTDGKLTLTTTTLVGDVTSSMWILSTDYDNYAVVYSCRQVTLSWWSEPYESVWVLTREQTLTSDVSLLIEAAMDVVAHDGGPSLSDLTASSQKNCS